MTAENWDDLAECAQWSQKNAAVLVDTLWVGGDPGLGEVYGWASWTPQKGLLALRNPSSKPAAITLDLAQAFELPPKAPRQFRLRSPWKDEITKPSLELEAGAPHSFQLGPFEVAVFEALPTGQAAAAK